LVLSLFKTSHLPIANFMAFSMVLYGSLVLVAYQFSTIRLY